LAVVNALLDHGADVNAAKKDGGTALMAAAEKKNNVAVVQALLAHRADVNARGRDGMSALAIAKVMNYPHTARLLKKAGGRE
jgi:ankyrin repeat protein